MRPEVFLALGLVFGGFVGVLTDNIPLWAGAGLVLGACIAGLVRRRQPQE